MVSAYLTKPLRTEQQVIADALAGMADTYLVLDATRGGLYLREADLGQTLGAVVFDLATGQYDHKNPKTGLIECPIGVLRVSRDAPVENVTDKVAESVLRYLIDHPEHLYDEEGCLKPCAFLDQTIRNWEQRLPRGVGRVDPPEAA